MADMGPPRWLRAAMEEFAAAPRLRPLAAAEAGPPAPGDIWLCAPVEPDRERRLLLVLGQDAEQRLTSCMLASNATYMAADRDVVLPAAAGGLPFDLLLERDVIGPVEFERLTHRVARIDRRLVALLRPIDLQDGLEPAAEPETAARHRRLIESGAGLPLHGADDPRLRFKLEELAAMDALVAAFKDDLAPEEPAVQVVAVVRGHLSEGIGMAAGTGERVIDHGRIHGPIAVSVASGPSLTARLDVRVVPGAIKVSRLDEPVAGAELLLDGEPLGRRQRPLAEAQGRDLYELLAGHLAWRLTSG
jgi:hypothetical protein